MRLICCAAGQPDLTAEFCEPKCLPVVVEQQQEQQPEHLGQQHQQQQPGAHPGQQQQQPHQQQHWQQTPAVSNGTPALHAMSIDGAEGASPTPPGGRQVQRNARSCNVCADASRRQDCCLF